MVYTKDTIKLKLKLRMARCTRVLGFERLNGLLVGAFRKGGRSRSVE